jgi:hypothetical protein
VGIRETLNQNPRLTTALTIGIIVVVLGFLAWQIWGGATTPGSAGGPATKRWFTDDDGKTWFAGDFKKVAPIQHNGKEAVEALVYKCDGKTFVNHMIRYTPEGKKRMEALLGGGGLADPAGAGAIETEMEVKSPGEKEWVKANSPKANDVRKPKCSNTENMEQIPAQ